MIRTSLIVALAWVSASCGFTVGVDALEENYRAEHASGGIARVVATDLAVRDDVVIVGESDRIAAELHTTRWSSGGDSVGRVKLGFEERGTELALAIGGATETSSVDRLDLELASGVGLSVEVEAGSLDAKNLDGDIFLKSASLVSVENCSGPIRIDAPSTTLVAVDPVDLEASDGVSATLESGGFMTASSLTIHLDAVNGDLLASTQGAGNAGIQLFVPRDTPLTLVLRAKQRINVDLAGYTFDSDDPERPDDGLDIVEGITVDIEGGGPQIDLAAETTIFIQQSDS